MAWAACKVISFHNCDLPQWFDQVWKMEEGTVNSETQEAQNLGKDCTTLASQKAEMNFLLEVKYFVSVN